MKIDVGLLLDDRDLSKEISDDLSIDLFNAQMESILEHQVHNDDF